MKTFAEQFAPFAGRMHADGLPELFIQIFSGYYAQLREGSTGLISESEIEPVASLPDAESLPTMLEKVGMSALGQTVIIKLNGGLGTSMGLEQAKSLLVVKEGSSFLDITAQQAVRFDVPLILMDSFVTHQDSLQLLGQYDALDGDLPVAFLQHRQPKVAQADLSPISWPQDPSLEWCPPGHGDIYAALVTSGTLEALRRRGFLYAFVSNSDNLGAVIDTRILGYFAEKQLPFLMEAADRTEMDRKGGHLALESRGRLLLRESAQTAPEDVAAFQNIKRHKYFNTNNLWLNLASFQTVMAEQNNVLGLPMIRNIKSVDPRNPDSPTVYHLETAMGSAINVFEGAEAIRVPRSRFAPVKKTNDLLAIRSDAYSLTEDFKVIPTPGRGAERLVVELDEAYYRFVTDLDARFPEGPPSLVDCHCFKVVGDIRFGRGVVCRGEVQLINRSGTQAIIPDSTQLTGTLEI